MFSWFVILILTVLTGFAINYIFFSPGECAECAQRQKLKNKEAYQKEIDSLSDSELLEGL